MKRPESVLVVVTTEANEVLLLRRRDPPDFWQSVTGSLEWGESPLAAARRELFEETGLFGDANLEDTGIINEYEILPAWREKYAADVHRNREHVFHLRLREIMEVRLNPEEHVEHRWLPAAEAVRLASSRTDREAIHLLTRS